MCTVPDNLNFLPKTLFNDEIFPIDNSFRACELLTGISSSDNENTGTISTVKPISLPSILSFSIVPSLFLPRAKSGPHTICERFIFSFRIERNSFAESFAMSLSNVIGITASTFVDDRN